MGLVKLTFSYFGYDPAQTTVSAASEPAKALLTDLMHTPASAPPQQSRRQVSPPTCLPTHLPAHLPAQPTDNPTTQPAWAESSSVFSLAVASMPGANSASVAVRYQNQLMLQQQQQIKFQHQQLLLLQRQLLQQNQLIQERDVILQQQQQQISTNLSMLCESENVDPNACASNEVDSGQKRRSMAALLLERGPKKPCGQKFRHNKAAHNGIIQCIAIGYIKDKGVHTSICTYCKNSHVPNHRSSVESFMGSNPALKLMMTQENRRNKLLVDATLASISGDFEHLAVSLVESRSARPVLVPWPNNHPQQSSHLRSHHPQSDPPRSLPLRSRPQRSCPLQSRPPWSMPPRILSSWIRLPRARRSWGRPLQIRCQRSPPRRSLPPQSLGTIPSTFSTSTMPKEFLRGLIS